MSNPKLKNFKIFHIAETSKIALIGPLLSNSVLSKNTQTTQFLSDAPPYVWLIKMTHPSSTKVEVFGFVTNGHFRDNKDTNLEFRLLGKYFEYFRTVIEYSSIWALWRR